MIALKLSRYSLILLCGLTVAAYANKTLAAEAKQVADKAESQLSEQPAQERDVFGWVERVQLHPLGISVKAKLDSGAQTSSLDARNIRVVRQGKQRYVRFDFIDPETKKVTPMRLKRVRGVRIIRHSGNHQRRHVVELDLCLGQHLRKIEVNLIDRSNFIYPLLLGRHALQDIALIDPGSTFLQKPACEYKAELETSKESEVVEDPEKLDYQDEKENSGDLASKEKEKAKLEEKIKEKDNKKK